jgi:hypothetical protein
LLDVGERRAEIIRMRDLLESCRQQLLFRVAEYVAERTIDLQPTPLCRDKRHADGRVIEGAAE